MKNFVLLIILLMVPFFLFSQDATKKETQDWIKDKIELYAYNDNETAFNYKVNFDATSIIIDEELIHNVGGHLNHKISIPLKNLMQVTFKEKTDNVSMYLKLRNNAVEIKDESIISGETKYTSTYQLMFQKSIDSEGLRPRLTKAFKHLVKLYGGIIVAEKF
ncbi:hypothetical protein [Gillisia sp. JM1]|uniref:hypothetical protein n=1 Tax=Gillisia sp. JM1 TaxID=1283286 RepID=UPI0004270A65|nr:hypothetical protein [Gillisia sp. JM1]